MNTGCSGPFCHGKGGWCGCNCKCCPPPCCPVIAVFFDCGAPQTPQNPQGCVFSPPMSAWDDIQVPLPAPMPEFSRKPIVSDDKRYAFGQSVSNCSVPCETICVELRCGGSDKPCCCLELLNGKIFSVGNGYVTAPSTVSIPGCETADVYINGFPPPVFVNDCEEIHVTIVTENDCCQCQQIDATCSLCPVSLRYARQKPLWSRKVDARTGKMKINPKSGMPIITINRTELIKRIFTRIKMLRRKK
jgi:hypothetical protein